MQFCCFPKPEQVDSINQEPHPLSINDFIDDFNNTTINVISGVATATFTYIQDTFPSWIFHAMHIACPALIGNLTHKGDAYTASPLLLGLMYRGKNLDDAEAAFLTLQLVSVAAIAAELALNILFPPNLYVHLAVKAIMLFSGIVSNTRSICQGLEKIHQGLTDSQLETSTKIAYVVSGLISFSLGSMGCLTVFETAKKLRDGLRVFEKLDPTQQMFALKYHALESIGEVKPRNAVIISGISSKWAEEGRHYFDDTPRPSSYVIYQNYNTRTYEVKSPEEFAKALDQASKQFGEKLDLIALIGHANNQEMRLNENYNFTGTKLEIQSIKKHIADAGELLLWGCETAHLNQIGQSLAKKISSLISHIQVTGFAESLYPAHAWVWFDKTLRVLAWQPGSFIWNSFAKVYQKGQVI